MEIGFVLVAFARLYTRPFGLQMRCPSEAAPGALVVLIDGGVLPFLLQPRSDGEEDEAVYTILGSAVPDGGTYADYGAIATTTVSAALLCWLV